MACKGHQDHFDKHYHAKTFYETYFVKKSGFMDDSTLNPLDRLYKIFKSGALEGDLLIQIGYSFIVPLLLSPSVHFKEIIVASSLESDFEELKKWLERDPTAMDWTPALEDMYKLEGDRKPGDEKVEILRRSVNKFLKCDVMEANPLSPITVPKADCLLTCYYLEAVCKDIKSFTAALKNISTLLKPGGSLVIMVVIESTFFLVGKVKFQFLYLNEDIVKKALCEAGYDIEKYILIPRTCAMVIDNCDYSGVATVVAKKNR